MAAELRETHSALVVLVGDRAYKVKKPVSLGFLDFTSGSARDDALKHEFELNRRICADVYLDVARLVGSDGAPIESVLVMRRMPDARRLSTMVGMRTIDASELRRQLRRIAQTLAQFHARAERAAGISAEAGYNGLRRRWTDNFTELERFVGTCVDPAVYERIQRLALTYVHGRRALFDRRGAAGLYVDGHGDITADDVFCLDDGPRILDCIDFDDRLRSVDVLDDAAFLAMELEHLGRPELARYFLDTWAEFASTPIVASLEHHYIAYRALVRAKVACLQSEEGDASAHQDAVDGYLVLALRHLEGGEVRLIVVGGAPGTGKSTVAALIAEMVGAALLSTDVIRRMSAGLPRYDDEARLAVYDELLERAEDALARGESVVADGTWPTDDLRERARGCAAASRARLIEVECHAPPGLAAARAQRRAHLGTDPSQADGAVALMLAERRTAWPTATGIDCSGSPHEAVRSIARLLGYPPDPVACRVEP